MTVAARLVADLSASSLDVHVWPPGSTIGALPAVHVTPADSTLGPGGLFVDHGYHVLVAVSRVSAPAQLDRLEQMTDQVAAALVAAGWDVADRITYRGDTTDGVAWAGREFTVTAPGERWC